MCELFFENCAWRGFRLVSHKPDIEIGWHIGLRCIDIKEYWDNGHRATETYVRTFEELIAHFKSYSHNLNDFEDAVFQRLTEALTEEL